jgi:hypothetical protein
MKSLVRVHTKVRDPKKREYIQAVKEFVDKMGGPEQVEFVLEQMKSEPVLFNNTVPLPLFVKHKKGAHPDPEDPYLCM